jgi:predicted helicase
MSTTFRNVLTKLRNSTLNSRDLGTSFEKLMLSYLKVEPMYNNLFEKIWLWRDFPGRDDLGGADLGIDLVALTKDDEYWAIQCKCYSEDTIIDKREVDSFISTSTRSFKSERLDTTIFTHRLWISTTNKWGKNALETLRNQNPQVSMIHIADLEASSVDWETLITGNEKVAVSKKEIYPHVREISTKVNHFFKAGETRGKLIMACGTGKTMTSLKIAEEYTDHQGFILFLVPSIALVAQTLKEWSSQSEYKIYPICICSDATVSKLSDQSSFSIVDLPFPATTDSKKIKRQLQNYSTRRNNSKGMIVVFSTYQSIDAIAEAQKELIDTGFKSFDLIICDEAHRTTGYQDESVDDSHFLKVHKDDFILAEKRLYMTATPRLFSDDAKSKAKTKKLNLWSMDDEQIYGKEIHRLGFGEAVEKGFLTDYKVIILTVANHDVPTNLHDLADINQYQISDINKLYGTISALSKKFVGLDMPTSNIDPAPMKKAVAFCDTIKNSKNIAQIYKDISQTNSLSLNIEAKHIDGGMATSDRDSSLLWLKEDVPSGTCRILTNVRVLSEGVDVPSLDAVIFLSSKNSQVEIVQSVGRVMRKSPNKKYGYIIIPIITQPDVEPEEALNNSKTYDVIWSVLNALRSHDDSFNAMVNQSEINRKIPSKITVGKPITNGGNGHGGKYDDDTLGLPLVFTESFKEAFLAKIVQKVGDRGYWESWAKDIAQIVVEQIDKIKQSLLTDQTKNLSFQHFLTSLQQSVSSHITYDQALEMLGQHLITRPIFEVLFGKSSFTSNNPISQAMTQMLSTLGRQDDFSDQEEALKRFYASVKNRVEGITDPAGKQKIIVELYDKFFKVAFPKMVEQLGIVYTPIEVVDFMIHSINDILIKEFSISFNDNDVQILDPFTGTGTFITRLIQSGLIRPEILKEKMERHIFANEIILLAYYIATINIETAYQEYTKSSDYMPFEGIVLTDTFQIIDDDPNSPIKVGKQLELNNTLSEMKENSERVSRIKQAPIKIIMGNPPYSVGQNSANDDLPNQSYENIHQRISDTYVKNSDAQNKSALYNSYIKAFRWSSDKILKNGNGILCFVTDGGWLDSKAHKGFRKSLVQEFSSIYIFNLRGNQRTQGETSRKEGGKIFGSGSRTPISIALLIKKPQQTPTDAKIYYRDIGDYLTREEKLDILKKNRSFLSEHLDLIEITPDDNGDWINHRNLMFDQFIPLFEDGKNSIFNIKANGVDTSRDSWCYSFSKEYLFENIVRLIDRYNFERKKHYTGKRDYIAELVDKDPKNIKWSRALFNKAESNIELGANRDYIVQSNYRPFTPMKLYFSRDINEYVGIQDSLFPLDLYENNLVITCTGIGASTQFSAFMSNKINNKHFLGTCICLPLFYYKLKDVPHSEQLSLFETNKNKVYEKQDGISDWILKKSREVYDDKYISKEDIFFYVYGLLHSKDYQDAFANDLKKTNPRIPLVETVQDFKLFSQAGKELSNLHINYENHPRIPSIDVEIASDPNDEKTYKINKMSFLDKAKKDTIIYNNLITIKGIPIEAYEYVVGGKTAIAWIMDRYQVSTDPDSGITNDPNSLLKEDNRKPDYILNLLLSIISVSIQSTKLINNLPKLAFYSGISE